MSGRKILFFTQSALYGGDDRVLIEIMNSWPDIDAQFLLITNPSHPGLEIYKSSVKRPLRIVTPDIKSAAGPYTLGNQTGKFNTLIAKFAKILGRPFFLIKDIRVFYALLRDADADALIISAGGYPVGDLTWRMVFASWLFRFKRRIVIIHNYPHIPGTIARKIYFSAINFGFSLMAPRLVTVSNDCACALSRFIGLANAPLVIPNGICAAQTEKDLSLDAKYSFLSGRTYPLLGAMGHIEPRKGFEYIIRAMPEILAVFPACRAVIIGSFSDANHKDYLLSIINELRLEGKVLLTGFIEDSRRFFECFDIAIISSVEYESFGLVALEAMRYQKPVIAARTGGLPEVVADGRTGLIIPPRDASTLAKTVINLLKSPRTIAEMGKNGYMDLNDKFSATLMAERYKALLFPNE